MSKITRDTIQTATSPRTLLPEDIATILLATEAREAEWQNKVQEVEFRLQKKLDEREAQYAELVAMAYLEMVRKLL